MKQLHDGDAANGNTMTAVSQYLKVFTKSTSTHHQPEKSDTEATAEYPTRQNNGHMLPLLWSLQIFVCFLWVNINNKQASDGSRIFIWKWRYVCEWISTVCWVCFLVCFSLNAQPSCLFFFDFLPSVNYQRCRAAELISVTEVILD